MNTSPNLGRRATDHPEAATPSGSVASPAARTRGPRTLGVPTAPGVPAVDLAGQLIRGDLSMDMALSVQPGEIVAVVGPNGAGKTTLLRLLAGLERLDHGLLRLDGLTVDDATDPGHVASHDRSVGWVPQDRLLFPHLSVAANVGFSPGATPSRVDHLLATLDLRSIADRRPSECSGGQAQRVAVARALAGSPSLLLLDEPSTALDAASRRRIHVLLGADDRPATLLVTHDPVEAAGIAHRVIQLDAGRIVTASAL